MNLLEIRPAYVTASGGKFDSRLRYLRKSVDSSFTLYSGQTIHVSANSNGISYCATIPGKGPVALPNYTGSVIPPESIKVRI
jgi:hypothetical protein